MIIFDKNKSFFENKEFVLEVIFSGEKGLKVECKDMLKCRVDILKL